MEPGYPEDVVTIESIKKEAPPPSFDNIQKPDSQILSEKHEKPGRGSMLHNLFNGGVGDNSPLLQMFSAMQRGNMSNALSLLGMKGDGMHMLDLLKGMKFDKQNFSKQNENEIVVEKPISSYQKIESED